ncbi:hypothetical protein QN277_023438 [Acacia crassicarpa]|uniref:Uncharacterized protein n=1 Tax=Acacia crassicarpa TaxID=499986 RepID=A0AAE1MN10_9FABA|nr:hypothetical protein QN277_023438 [Acacia crassicarpa]
MEIANKVTRSYESCSLHYFCTSQFVVMFTGSDGSDKSISSCNAYISQSTRGLRSLLRKHVDIFLTTQVSLEFSLYQKSIPPTLLS